MTLPRQTCFYGPNRKLHAIVYAQFAHEGRELLLHGACREKELLSDFFVGEAICDQGKQLGFSFGEQGGLSFAFRRKIGSRAHLFDYLRRDDSGQRAFARSDAAQSVAKLARWRILEDVADCAVLPRRPVPART